MCDNPPTKRRKLRPLGETFTTGRKWLTTTLHDDFDVFGPARKADNPTEHGGRVRSQPHVDGQWSTHLYLEVEPPAALLHTLQELLNAAPDNVQSQVVGQPLHLSLSRPVNLWTRQRPDFMSAVRSSLAGTRPFTLSFASLAVLTNDEGTRSFLTCEVGFGYKELLEITQSLDKVLQERHLPAYYTEPRFHISLGWWLPQKDKDILSNDALAELEKQYGKDIRKHELKISAILLKIGKDVTRLGLS